MAVCARAGERDAHSAPFSWKGCKVLEYARHKRKLRLGALKGNAFTLVLRETSDRRDVETRCEAIRDGGVPELFWHTAIRHWWRQLAGALRWAQK